MAIPPPYNDITGLYLTDDKHIQVTLAGYDGTSRPGQLVVDTADYSLWVGDSAGDLNLLATPTGYYPPLVINNLTGNYTLGLTDPGTVLYGEDLTLTIPTFATTAIPVGSYVTIATSTDIIIVDPASVAVSIYLSGNIVAGSWIIPARSIARLTKVETNVWYLDGANIVSF
jgi:hypothetical protein